jgi:hypothetical protein
VHDTNAPLVIITTIFRDTVHFRFSLFWYKQLTGFPQLGIQIGELADGGWIISLRRDVFILVADRNTV